MDPRMSFMTGPSQVASSLGSIASGFFTDAGAPYHAAMGPYNQYMGKAENVQNPFLQAGQGALPQYQQFLQSMQNPSDFINHLMGQYQQSPFAQYEQNQAIRGGQNAASASGLIGSTPFAQQLQQNASNISSQDMQNWLQNVLGINTQYGQGLSGLIGGGQQAANSLSGLYSGQAEGAGNLAYGQRAGQNQNTGNIIGGLLSLF